MSVPAEPIQVILVDDEPLALAGMRRRLRGYNDRWSLSLFEDPEEAVEAVCHQGADVVLCELLLRPLRGDAILEEIRRASPRTLRIIMTGCDDPDMLLESVGPTHGVLLKPCLGDEIERAIGRASRLRATLDDVELERALGGIVQGPLFPANHSELVDPTGARTNGLDESACAVLAAKILEQFRVGTAAGVDPNESWRRGRTAAEFGRRICEVEGLSGLASTHVTLACLLHGLGPLLLARHAPGRSPSAAACRENDRGPQSEPLIQNTADALAAYALQLWGFPEEVVEAVGLHRAPSSGMAPLDRRVVSVVHVACVLAGGSYWEEHVLAQAGLDLGYCESIPSAGTLQQWIDACVRTAR